MPIATRRRGGIGRSGLVRESSVTLDTAENAGRHSLAAALGRRLWKKEGDEEDGSCSTSSIGQDSDLLAAGSGSDGEESGETEVQSKLKGPLETIEALQESLPMRRGLSKFYCGRSKSYTNLADAESCSSAKELAKPENVYTRKRRNVLAYSIMYDKSFNNEQGSIGGGRSAKRLANSSRSMPSICNASIEEEQDAAQLPLSCQQQQGESVDTRTAESSIVAREKDKKESVDRI